MDRTEAQIRQKLLDAEFEPELAEQAIGYVKGFGYLDDERYTRNYIECRRERKSRRELERELQYRKGVSPELIRKVYEELEPVDERVLIRRELKKKHYVPGEADAPQRRRIMASLVRRGFETGDILAVMREEPDDGTF